MQASPPNSLSNAPEYTVSELSNALKRVVEGNFEHVKLRGEISGFKRAASGHLYMSLKDVDAVINAICWRGVSDRLAVPNPQDGMEVIVTGKISTYAGRSNYQIVIDSMELAGEGAILKMLEERKKKLEAEGLFDPARKKPLPFLPTKIGVITSPTGAVIHDIQTTLERRFPRPLMLAGVNVQGDTAARAIANAIRGFSNLPESDRPDVLIIARGGGSLEDLLPFSEESVVRAVAACPIPTISSVGHETDTMLIDYAADRRAPTPTAAAEMSVPVRDELLVYTQQQSVRLMNGLHRFLSQLKDAVTGLGRGLVHPGTHLMNLAQRVDDLAGRTNIAMATKLERGRDRLPQLPRPTELIHQKEARLERLTTRLSTLTERLIERADTQLSTTAKLLESYSYKKVLARGFALVRDTAGTPLLSAAAAQDARNLTLTFADGDVAATAGEGSQITPIKKKAQADGKTKKPAPKSSAAKPNKTDNNPQEELF